MPPFGFVGPSYRLQAINADNQMTMNLFPEVDESGKGVAPLPMFPTPGLEVFAERGNKTRGQKVVNTREFVVFDADLCEVDSAGTITFLGNVETDGNPVSMAATNNQLLVESVGLLYVFNLNTNTFSAVAPATISGVLQVDVIDAFFVAAIAGTNTFRLSALNDATTWDPLDEAVIEVFTGNIGGIKVDHRELWIWGVMGQSTVYYNNGDVNFPLVPSPSAAVIEQGIIAVFSSVKLDNTVFWIGGDTERGIGIGWRASGYTPVRVTTHAVELAWQSYGAADLTNSVAYSYQEDGHSFWVIRFPAANKTWAYDVSTNMWAERGFWNVNTGTYNAHHSWNHSFFAGKHLVGDWNSGKLYWMHKEAQTDNGALIRRLRRAPCLSAEQKWIFISEIQLYLESGVTPQPVLLDGAGNPREPQINLRWSKDAGHTWSNEITRGIGFPGQYRKRVRWLRIPRGRNMVLEINMSDPVSYRIVDCYAGVVPGSN